MLSERNCSQATLIKEVSTPLTPILAAIFNNSFASGKFPSTLKLAKVIPVYKTGASDDVGNYRPISLLSVFSKLLEKAVKKRLVVFLNKNNFFLI